MILASSIVILPSATTLRHRRHSTAASATKPRQKHNPKHKSRISTSTAPLPSFRWDDKQSLTNHTELASKLMKEGRFEDFLMVAESVVASGVTPLEFLSLLNSGNVASGIGRALGEGNVDSVDLLFAGVTKIGIEPVQLFDGAAMGSLKEECRRLLRCGAVEQLVSLMEMLAGFRFQIKELVEPSDVINLCITKRDPTAAIRYAQSFPHVEVLFCSITLEFGKKRDLVSALTAFETLKQKLGSPNMHVYRTMIDVCGLCGDYLKSRAIYEELLADNVTPNTYVFNSLMNVNARDLNYTLDIYKKMEKLGVAADIATHNILLKSCRLAAKVELARDIYREIRKLEGKGALKLDVFTYSTVIKVFADANMWKMALEIKEDMVSSGVTPNTVTWSSLISACANAGLVEQASKLFDEMLQAGCQPNSQCFNILLHACIKACQFDRAFRLFQCWKESGFQQTIADGKLNNADEFVQVDQMKVPVRPYSHFTARVPFKPTTWTYNLLMKACGTDYYRAQALMDEMKTLGLSPNQVSWSILLDVFGGSGNISGVIQTLRSMRETGIQPDVITYTLAIKICVEHKKSRLAFMIFAQMLRYQVKPNQVTYNTILRAHERYRSLKQVQKSLYVYQHMRKAGYKPNDNYLKQLIEEWCEGVIQKELRNKGSSASNTTDSGSHSLLLEKVAEHLQDNNAESLSIDLQGLSKVEARIVLLAVLRKTKENYRAGNLIKDDVLIILGRPGESEVREGVVRLLQHDLRLEVYEVDFRTGINITPNKGELEGSGSSQATESPTKRPVILQRLKVTRESLHHWLQRKMGAKHHSHLHQRMPSNLYL